MCNNEKTVFDYGFELLTDDKRTMFDKYRALSNGYLSSCSNLPSIIGWENSTIPYYKTVGDSLCIIFNDSVYDTWIAFPPMCDFGTDNFQKSMELLDSVFRAMELPFRMYYIKEWMLPYLEKAEGFTSKKSCDESLSDYIYSYENFVGYLHKADIRYNIRYCQRRFEPMVESLSPENICEYIDFLKKTWCAYHSCEDCVYGCMHEALKNMLDSAPKTGFESFIVRSGGKCIAYAGYTVCGDELVILIKKVDKSMKGLTDFVHNQIINEVRTEISQINYTEDMGVEGLRRYKQKLAPYELSHNYEITFRRNEF